MLNAVAIVVGAVVLVGLLDQRHAPIRTSTGPKSLRHRIGGPTGTEYPLGAIPTLSQLLNNFAVLRRPQTAADRSWHPECACGGAARQLNRYTRLATTLPDGSRVFLDMEQFILGGQLSMAAGSHVLNIDIVDPHGSTSSQAFGPNVQYSVFPLVSGGAGRLLARDLRSRQANGQTVLAGIVPDGVASVSWTFACRPVPRLGRCPVGSPRTFTVPVTNNVAARQIPNAWNCRPCNPDHVTWRSADGRVVASFGGPTGNLAAPPFIKGGSGSRLLNILHPSAIGNARLGESSSAATRTIAQVLGPPADANVRSGSCGIDHESVWTSPTVAEPLTIFERRPQAISRMSPACCRRQLNRVMPEGTTLANVTWTSFVD